MSGTQLEVVAIDGPSGAGKSTIAKAVAARLGWRHLDTGSMYRAVTLRFLEAGVDLEDRARVEAELEALDLRLGESGRVWLDGREITVDLRSGAVEGHVSAVSAVPLVRARMRELQRREAERGKLVAEGRDMTSVVFPDARFKVFLDADPRERARRRLGDHRKAGREADLEGVLADIERRDGLDSSREDSPLVRVEDAVYVDSSGMTIEEVVEHIVGLVQEGPAT